MLGKYHCKAPIRKKEESDRLRGEGDKLKFIDLRFESCRIQERRKGKTLHKFMLVRSLNLNFGGSNDWTIWQE